jgi:transcriptional regulator with XRE-family HTH domain
MSLYSRIAARPGGKRDLAAARLRYEALVLLQEAFEASGLTSQVELAKKLKVRRSAVNQVLRGDGNVRITTLAEYLYEMGFEALLTLTEAEEPRRAAIDDRPARPVQGPMDPRVASGTASLSDATWKNAAFGLYSTSTSLPYGASA